MKAQPQLSQGATVEVIVIFVLVCLCFYFWLKSKARELKSPRTEFPTATEVISKLEDTQIKSFLINLQSSFGSEDSVVIYAFLHDVILKHKPENMKLFCNIVLQINLAYLRDGMEKGNTAPKEVFRVIVAIEESYCANELSLFQMNEYDRLKSLMLKICNRYNEGLYEKKSA